MVITIKLFDVPAFGSNKDKFKVVEFCIDDRGSGKLVNKLKKLFKLNKLSKSKKLSKSENLSKNDATGVFSYLIPSIKTAFNCLQLTFTQAQIYKDFNPECYILINIDISSYAICNMQYQQIFRTSPNRVITKNQWHLVLIFIKN